MTGVDISPRQIDLARRTGITATVASGDNLPLADQSVDAVATIMTTTDFDNLPVGYRWGMQRIFNTTTPDISGVRLLH